MTALIAATLWCMAHGPVPPCIDGQFPILLCRDDPGGRCYLFHSAQQLPYRNPLQWQRAGFGIRDLRH